MSVKEAAHPAIEALPDTASLQDAADRVALLAALEKGRKAVREGRWKSPEEGEKLLSSWLEKQSGRTRQKPISRPSSAAPQPTTAPPQRNPFGLIYQLDFGNEVMKTGFHQRRFPPAICDSNTATSFSASSRSGLASIATLSVSAWSKTGSGCYSLTKFLEPLGHWRRSLPVARNDDWSDATAATPSSLTVPPHPPASSRCAAA